MAITLSPGVRATFTSHTVIGHSVGCPGITPIGTLPTSTMLEMTFTLGAKESELVQGLPCLGRK